MLEPKNLVELVGVETADGLFLEGILERPKFASGQLQIDAFLLIHGTGSNFYAPGVLEAFAAQAVSSGTAVLRINTRGHDGVCSIPGRKGSAKGGATYERIGDCPLDMAAWLDWVLASGFHRVVLVGHSMGGVKAIYSQAYAAHPAVSGIVGISPPRFVHELLRTGPRGELFCKEFARAQELVAAGHGNELLAVTQPVPCVATAAGYVEKYGPENRYDYVPLLARLTCPTLILIGSESIKSSAAFQGLPAAIAEITPRHPRLTCQVVEGANINYSGCETAPWLYVSQAAGWFLTSSKGES